MLLVGRTDFFSQLEDDINGVFFNQTEFGETLHYYHAKLDEWTTYRTLYDDPHSSAQFGSEAEFNTMRPQVQIQESKLAHPITKQDQVKIQDIRYTVDDYISDGVGITTLYLHRLKQ